MQPLTLYAALPVCRLKRSVAQLFTRLAVSLESNEYRSRGCGYGVFVTDPMKVRSHEADLKPPHSKEASGFKTLLSLRTQR